MILKKVLKKQVKNKNHRTVLNLMIFINKKSLEVSISVLKVLKKIYLKNSIVNKNVKNKFKKIDIRKLIKKMNKFLVKPEIWIFLNV